MSITKSRRTYKIVVNLDTMKEESRTQLKRWNRNGSYNMYKWLEGLTMRATNIKWDVDFEEQLEDLPTEIEIPDGMTDEEEISDYISDETGFCHYGFELED